MILQVFDSIMGIIEKCQGIIWILHYDEDIWGMWRNFFFFLCFCQTSGSFSSFSPLLPLTEVSPQPSAIRGGNPSGDWQSAVGWGDTGFEPGTAVWRATIEPPRLPMSHHASPGVWQYNGNKREVSRHHGDTSVSRRYLRNVRILWWYCKSAMGPWGIYSKYVESRNYGDNDGVSRRHEDAGGVW
jgi:hypothetical protein